MIKNKYGMIIGISYTMVREAEERLQFEVHFLDLAFFEMLKSLAMYRTMNIRFTDRDVMVSLFAQDRPKACHCQIYYRRNRQALDDGFVEG
jgi:hypothetical protein